MNPQDNSQKPKINKDVWLFLFIVFPVICIWLFSKCSAVDNRATSNCYDQTSQDILSRDGNKTLNREDVERYASEMTSNCK